MMEELQKRATPDSGQLNGGEGTNQSGKAQNQYNTTGQKTNSPKPDLSEAKRLLDSGMKLVRLHDYQKRPIGEEWNKHAAKSIDPKATGYGLPLAVNNLCSIDPDHMEMARIAMKSWGFDLDELLEQGVRTASTRPGSGGRSAFTADEMEMCRWIPFRVFDDEGNGITILELRAKSANLQDCVPGLVYADKQGGLCTQTYANENRFDDAPELPDNFARFWRLLSTQDDELREFDRIAFEAIRDAGFKVNDKPPKHYQQMGKGETLPFEAPGIRGPFNRENTVESIIDRHGYTYHQREQRWSHPGATGAPGIRPIPGKDELWQSDHAGDRLHGTFDAWAAYVQLNHAGDVEAAVRAYQKAKQDEVISDFKGASDDELFTPEARSAVQLPDSFKQTVIGKLAARVAYCLEFPEASTAMALLTGASAAVATSYAVQYASGTPIPAGLYTVIEQPPSMMKSRLLGFAQTPYLKAMGEHNRAIATHNKGLAKDDPKACHGFTVTTDPTTAGMDMVLATCSEGRFFVASAEQAAFQTMFPEKADFASHNGLLLQGWAGEYASAMRKGRAAFTGYASGSVLVIAQPGSAARVFNASNGTGLAERFFYVSEPTTLGTRTLHGDFVRRDELEPFDRACKSCVEDYSRRRFATLEMAQDPDALRQIAPTDAGYRLLLQARRKLEPKLGRLASEGELLQVGWLGKIETHALKVALNLHVIEYLAQGKAVPEAIPEATVKTALDLILVLAEHFGQLLQDSGETGEVAEVDSVIDLLAGSRKPYKVRTLAQTLRKRHPFRAMGKESYSRARARIEAMIKEGRLVALPDKTIEAA